MRPRRSGGGAVAEPTENRTLFFRCPRGPGQYYPGPLWVRRGIYYGALGAIFRPLWSVLRGGPRRLSVDAV